MDEYLQLLSQHHKFSTVAWKLILSDAKIIAIKKNQNLDLYSGRFTEKKAFIVRGHFKQFYIQEDGTEKILSFGFPGDYLLEHPRAMPMNVEVKAMSDAQVLVFTLNNKENCSCISQRLTLDICNYSLKQLADHLYILGLRTPYERYDYLAAHRPQLVSYIALTELSKYLNTSREALSRARVDVIRRNRVKQ